MDEKERLSLDVSKVFTPATPVSEKELFAGRSAQIHRIVDVINQRGQHAVIYGERGVGKTSLANVISSKLAAPGIEIVAPRINCDTTDDFSALWKKVFSQIELTKYKEPAGFQYTIFKETTKASDVIEDNVGPDDVRRLLTLFGSEKIVIIILDEFDRLSNKAARRAMADTIKALSDHEAQATIIIVGVADTVDDLIAEHQSVERALVQIQMPRMSRPELNEILEKGMKRLYMAISDEAKIKISSLSQGLPHYAHLLGLHSTRAAIEQGAESINIGHVTSAISKAVEDAQQSLKSDYRKAVTSSHKDSIYAEVLLACALAKLDEFGYFPAAEVRDPLSKIMKRPYQIPGFARHLNDFSNVSRGSILRKTGVRHRFKFRFSNPLMQPYVIMKGLVDKRIPEDFLTSDKF